VLPVAYGSRFVKKRAKETIVLVKLRERNNHVVMGVTPRPYTIFHATANDLYLAP